MKNLWSAPSIEGTDSSGVSLASQGEAVPAAHGAEAPGLAAAAEEAVAPDTAAIGAAHAEQGDDSAETTATAFAAEERAAAFAAETGAATPAAKPGAFGAAVPRAARAGTSSARVGGGAQRNKVTGSVRLEPGGLRLMVKAILASEPLFHRIASEAGLPPKVVSAELGHSTTPFTQDTYKTVLPRSRGKPRRPQQR